MIEQFLKFEALWPQYRRSDKAQAFWWYSLALENRHQHQLAPVTAEQLHRAAQTYLTTGVGEKGPCSTLTFLKEARWEMFLGS